MEKILSLLSAIELLDNQIESSVICVERPWFKNSRCVMVELDENLKVPEQLKDSGFEYFLEVDVAKEVLSVFDGSLRSLDDKAKLLIHYAENDAYPDWVYDQPA